MSTLSPLLLSYNNLINIIIAFLTIFWFNNLLVYDKKIKKITFSTTLLIIYWAADINHLSARTTLLFLKAVIWQVWIIGIIVWSRNAVSSFLLLKLKGKQKLIKNINWQYVFATVITIQVFSTIFLLLLIINFPNYYQSPFDFPQFKYIIIPFLFIFVGVAIFDKLFFKNYKNSTRRKTFHFVPVIVAPILIAINYKLAILLSVAAYFLFWQMETVRYFGKLARQQIQKQQKDGQKNQQSKQQQINLNKISLLNQRLQKFPLFLWMEQLNSSRQHHFYFTHLSLMLGLTLTFIFYPCSSNTSSTTHTCSPSISQNIPILIHQNMSVFLTIADAIAAIIGSKYGKHQISAKNKKTYQGYFGFVVTLVIIQLLLELVGVCFVGYTLNIQYVLIIVSAVFCGLGELFSGDMDNIATGLVYITVVSVYDKIFG